MKLIYDLINEIKEELEDAEHYYRMALYCKDNHHELSRKYIEIAKAELNHANLLHQSVVDLVSKEKAKGKEISEFMTNIYECEHLKYIDEYDELSFKLNKIAI